MTEQATTRPALPLLLTVEEREKLLAARDVLLAYEVRIGGCDQIAMLDTDLGTLLEDDVERMRTHMMDLMS